MKLLHNSITENFHPVIFIETTDMLGNLNIV